MNQQNLYNFLSQLTVPLLSSSPDKPMIGMSPMNSGNKLQEDPTMSISIMFVRPSARVSVSCKSNWTKLMVRPLSCRGNQVTGEIKDSGV